MSSAAGDETLGALLERLGGGLFDSPSLHTMVSFTERVTRLPAPGAEGDMEVEHREYRAEIDEQDDHSLTRINVLMQDGSMVRCRLFTDAERTWYAWEQGGFGPLGERCELFRMRTYRAQVHTIPLRDAEVLTGHAGGEGTLRAEVRLSAPAFALLLTLTGADEPESADDIGFLSHRVELLRHRGELRLRCTWTAAGTEEGLEDAEVPMVSRVRSTIVVACRPGETGLRLDPPPVDPSVPGLRDMDEIWLQLREHRAERSGVGDSRTA